MTETAFTPGPWGLASSIDVWVMAGSLHVATIPRAADGDWSPANAHLIAAAPELYEALSPAVDELSETLADLKEHGIGVDFVQQDISRLERIITASKAALSKARGEQ